MTTFTSSSSVEQFFIMVALFFTMLFCLFRIMIHFEENRRSLIQYFHYGLLVFLFMVLGTLVNTLYCIEQGLNHYITLSMPMWGLWGMVCILDGYFIYEGFKRNRQREELNDNSIKQAMDMFPNAICYFMPSGVVKLCNLQMYRLFHCLAQTDLQFFDELQKALEECDEKSEVKRISPKGQTYLFPDGKVWLYTQSDVAAKDGITYTEAMFIDVTELYEKKIELEEQTKELKKMSVELKQLSDHVLILAKEKEVLSAKTYLHDQMGAGLVAIRQSLQQGKITGENGDAIRLFQKAVSAIKNDNEYPFERSDFAEFRKDAQSIGIEVKLNGDLPKEEEIYRVFMIAMWECLTNSARHADATELTVNIQEGDKFATIQITNNGVPPKQDIKPKGGLVNLYRNVINCGGNMEIQSQPEYALTVTIPVRRNEYDTGAYC